MHLIELTGALIIFGCIFFLLYDGYVWVRYGHHPTVSYVLNRWISSGPPLLWIIIGAVLGGLLVHFTGWVAGPNGE